MINEETINELWEKVDEYQKWLDTQEINSFPERDIWSIELFLDWLKIDYEIQRSKNKK